MKETRSSINQWAEETFGAVPPLGIALRMNHEVAELLSALPNIEALPEDVLFECADIRIMLSQIEYLFGLRWGDPYVDSKMLVNRGRTWNKISGKIQHEVAVK